MNPRTPDPLRGVRFAPSPTGRFHVGNLRTAWISHELARHLGEPWVVRFEDIDGPRSAPGAREGQLEDMAALGLVPNEVHDQSHAHERHWEVFRRAAREGRVYPCFCSRKDVRDALAGAASAPHHAQPTYSGHCRGLARYPRAEEHGLPTLAWRFAWDGDPSGRGDFIIGRTFAPELARGPDGPQLGEDPKLFAPAYHWACAIDDWDGRYRLLVRASDLKQVLGQQRAIMRWLAGAQAVEYPAVYHAALVLRDEPAGAAALVSGSGVGGTQGGIAAGGGTAVLAGAAGGRLEKRTRGVTLPELVERGISAQELVRRFAASWDARAAFARLPVAGDVAGGVPDVARDIIDEQPEQISLARLGLTASEA